MTLPSSGALSLSDIQTEFGGSNPIGMSEYYAGGAFVPSSATGTNGQVPASGTISFDIFHGTTKESPLSVAAPDATNTVQNFSGSATVTAGTSIAPTGGSGSYPTYSTTYVSGDTVSASGLSTSTPSFSKSLAAGQQQSASANAVYRASVTDSGGHTAHHDFNVSLTYTNLSG